MIVGTSRIQPVAFAVFTSKELKKFKVLLHIRPFCVCSNNTNACVLVCVQKPSVVVLEKSDPVGWTLKAEVHSSSSVANGILCCFFFTIVPLIRFFPL